MSIKNRFRFGDFKLPNNFIILGVVSIVAIVIIVVIMMNINNHVIPVTTPAPTTTTPAPTTTTPAPTTTTPAPTVSPLNTDANRQLLNNINNQLKYYIAVQGWAISYELSDIIPSIQFGSNDNGDLYLDIDYGDGQTSSIGNREMTHRVIYRGAVDAINKFNTDRRTGLSIPYLV